MIGILGAGISGLTAAWELQNKGIDYILLESATHAGGYLRTEKTDKYILDCGPNSILCDDEVLNFFAKAGLKEKLLPANEVSKSRYIYKNGSYKKLPSNPIELLTSDFFRFGSKLKILTEAFRNSGTTFPNETLSSFFERHFGKEVVDYALNPFIAGIYNGDPAKLLAEKTFPSLVNYEKEHGSVLRGLIRNTSQRRKSYNFKNGMQEMTDSLAAQLKHLQLGAKVTSLKKEDIKIMITCEQDGMQKSILCDQVIITIPAFFAATILQEEYPEFYTPLKNINYPPIALVHTAYKKEHVKKLLNGFGGLNPKVENLFSAGGIWTSQVFEGRCPADEVLFTNFVGGSQSPEHYQLEDQHIVQGVHNELASNFKITTNPVFQEISHWQKTIPQYDLNTLETDSIVNKLKADNIYICATWHGGISLADSIKKSLKAAEKISAF